MYEHGRKAGYISGSLIKCKIIEFSKLLCVTSAALILGTSLGIEITFKLISVNMFCLNTIGTNLTFR